MKIDNLYTPFITAFEGTGRKDIDAAIKADSRVEILGKMAQEWGIDFKNVQRWMCSLEYKKNKDVALKFIADAPRLVKKVESSFKVPELKGELHLSPSMMRFDGFARYDSGSHTVWFGVDHPDGSDGYLSALLAHELSHVYRDHQPGVWAHLNKPLEKISRSEYLDSSTAQEHLASEGLATLFSQVVFPEVPLSLHHYYTDEEMQWCLQNFDAIDQALKKCLAADEDVWAFYGEGAVGEGSPSRTQYFWAAKVLTDWLPKKIPGKNFKDAVIEAHRFPAKEFDCFQPR